MELKTIKQIRFKRKPVVARDLFSDAIKPSYCEWSRMLRLFPYRKRSRIEKAMLLFGCQVIYLATLVDTDIPSLLVNYDWRRQWFPKLWANSLAITHLPQTDFQAIKTYEESVSSDLFLIFGPKFDSRIFNLIKKGYYK